MDEQPKKSEQQQPKPDARQEQKRIAWKLAGVGTEFAFYIAAPLLIFLWWVEPRLNPGHKSKLFMALGLLACLAVSAFMIGITINEYRKKLK